MEKNFFDKNWWQNATGALAGTLIGIVLTFGITFFIENANKREIVEKTLKLTIHNIDVAIRTVESNYENLAFEDSVYKAISAYYPDSIEYAPDELIYTFINITTTFSNHHVEDNTSSVFTSSFDVWQYIDDEKVISRINNAIALLDVCKEEYHSAIQMRREIFESIYKNELAFKSLSGPEFVEIVLSNSDFLLYTTQKLHMTLIYQSVLDLVKQLNDTNKRVMNLSQEELDELGNLLEQNSYDFNTDTKPNARTNNDTTR